jgi:katanin p60 ATPase-containing subunit A1
MSHTDETRRALLKLCLEGVAVDETLDSNAIADKLEGYTGSDISNVCRFVCSAFSLQNKAI